MIAHSYENFNVRIHSDPYRIYQVHNLSGLLWQPRFPKGSRPFPWANLPRAILTRAKFVRPLAAHQGADRSPLPSVFREEEIHYSLGREGFPVRLASHHSIRPPSREAARVSLTLSSTRSLSLAQFASREASAAATPASRGRRIPGGRRLAAHLSLRPATHLPALGGDVPPEIHGSTSISRNHIGGCLTHTAASSLLHRRRYRHPSLQVGPPPPASPFPTAVSRYARV